MNMRIADVNACASVADLGQARKDIMDAASVQVLSFSYPCIHEASAQALFGFTAHSPAL